MIATKRAGPLGNEPPEGALIVFAGGGTGGHLYPALAIAEALRVLQPHIRFRFLGTQRPIDRRILGGGDYDLIQQPVVALRAAPWRWPRILLGFRQASRLCRRTFERDRPDVVIGTGGLGSVPAVRQAVRMGIPTALLNPDALPGRANRHLGHSVDLIFAQWEEALDHFPSSAQVIVCGCAVREAFTSATRDEGIAHFGLDGQRKTLLVTGASQGAQTINQAVLANLDLLESLAGWQVLHLAGEENFEAVRQAYEGRALRVAVVPFTDRMAEALAAADLVVARAGASSLAEFTVMGRPSILMPYPFHRDRHQFANARCLVRALAARILVDKIDPALNGPALRELLEPLLTDDARRTAMAAAALAVGRQDAAQTIARRILGLIHTPRWVRRRESVEASL